MKQFNYKNIEIFRNPIFLACMLSMSACEVRHQLNVNSENIKEINNEYSQITSVYDICLVNYIQFFYLFIIILCSIHTNFSVKQM